jgi:hypothetical protein
MKGSTLLQGEIMVIEQVYTDHFLKCSLEPNSDYKASLDNANSSLFKSWSPGVGWGHNKENHFYWKKSSPGPVDQFQSKLVQIIPGRRELKLFQRKGQWLFSPKKTYY